MLSGKLREAPLKTYLIGFGRMGQRHYEVVQDVVGGELKVYDLKAKSDAIQIHCETTLKEALTIAITDNGIGISETHQSQLFDKFYRAGNKQIHDVKGLGLGLYYTNQIVGISH